ncbi:hypothetical protein SeLEV6574_g05033 [Synchytrium endobioticum]|uniref:Uncharacterized protein n=1 Tax=Synchytrium endobioticum TaxID=286115 RepID=A0A507CWB2_9FUNG|nr:hypothetical protein SeLEV6574_g05033 [Synchytrium endobioticum]
MRALFIIAIFLYCSSCALAGDPPEPQPSQLFKLFGPLWFRQQLKGVIVPYNYLAHHNTVPNVAKPSELRQLELWLRETRVMMLEKSNELMAERLAHPRRIHYKRAEELDCITQTDHYLGLPFGNIPPIRLIPLDFTLEEYRSMCGALRDFGDTMGRIRIDLGEYKCEYLKMRSARTSDETVKNELQAERDLLLNKIEELEQRLNDRERQLNGYLASLPNEDPRLQTSEWSYSYPPWFDQNNFHPSQGGGSSERDWTSQGGIYQAGTSTINQYLFGGTLGFLCVNSSFIEFYAPRNYGGDLGQTSGHGNTADGDVPHTSPGRDEGPSY